MEVEEASNETLVVSSEVGCENGGVLEGGVGGKDDISDGVKGGFDIVASAEVGSESGGVLEGGVGVTDDISDGVKRGFDIDGSAEVGSENGGVLEGERSVEGDMDGEVKRGFDLVESAEAGGKNGVVLEVERGVEGDMGDAVRSGSDLVGSAGVGNDNGVILEGERGVEGDTCDAVKGGSDLVGSAEVRNDNCVILEGERGVEGDTCDAVKEGSDLVGSVEVGGENSVILEEERGVEGDMDDVVRRDSDLAGSVKVGSENGVVLESEIVVKDDGGKRDLYTGGIDNEMKSGVETFGAENDSGLLVLHNVSVLVENVVSKENGDDSGGGKWLRRGRGSEYRSSLKERDQNGVTEMEGEEYGVEDEESDDDGSTGDQSCEYQVGDFVWGKIRSYPWWPGQIYSASDASEYALKLKQKDRFLVAYFGDGSFSWCSPSQLKPFVENFKVMSEQTNSKNFTYAVEAALDEVSRVVELEMTCSCLEEKNGKLEASMASNSGLKVGVLVPVGVGKSFIAQCEPKKVIDSLRNYAETVSMKNLLELTVMKSWLTVYCRAKGGYPLPLYHYPRGVEGLEDKTGNPVKVSVPGPNGEELLSAPVEAVGSGLDLPNQSLLQKCQETSSDILYQRRKQKSVAELIEDEMRKEESFVNESVSNVLSTGKRGRRQKAVASRSSRTLKEKIITCESNDSGGKEANETPPSNKLLSSGETEGEEETAKNPRSRGKKRSKYLSSPFTNPSQIMKVSSLKGDSEPESVKTNRVGERMARVAGQLIGLQSTGNTTSQTVSPVETGNNNVKSGNSSPETALQSHSKTDISMHFTASPVQLLSNLQSAAADPLCLKETSEVEIIKKNIAAFKNNVQQKSEPGSRKRKPEHMFEEENGMPPAKKAASGSEIMSENEDDTPAAQLGLIREKLKRLNSILDNSGGRVSVEIKSSLENEAKVLLEKVSSMKVSSS